MSILKNQYGELIIRGPYKLGQRKAWETHRRRKNSAIISRWNKLKVND